MRLSPLLSFLLQPLDVSVELLAVHPPDTSASDLDGGQLGRADEGIDLRDADAQVGRNVFQREEAGLYLRTRLFGRRGAWHRPRITGNSDGCMDLALFAAV